jgi:hypothetical protein
LEKEGFDTGGEGKDMKTTNLSPTIVFNDFDVIIDEIEILERKFNEKI